MLNVGIAARRSRAVNDALIKILPCKIQTVCLRLAEQLNNGKRAENFFVSLPSFITHRVVLVAVFYFFLLLKSLSILAFQPEVRGAFLRTVLMASLMAS